jgi:hypothetical protein
MFGKLLLFLLIAFAVAVSIPKTRAMLGEEAAPIINKYKAKIVPKRLDAMVDQLVVKVGRGEPLPSQKNAWAGWLHRDYSSDPEDPWGHFYYIETQRDGFTVGSMGPDGKKGTADDITRRHRFDNNR